MELAPGIPKRIEGDSLEMFLFERLEEFLTGVGGGNECTSTMEEFPSDGLFLTISFCFFASSSKAAVMER